jgi:hypothetical protein
MNKEQRQQNFREAEDALRSFMRSPVAKHVPDFLRMLSKCEPIMSATPEKTAHNLGAYETIKLLEQFGESR